MPTAHGFAASCYPQQTPETKVPGNPTELSTRMLDVGRDLLQRFAPLNAVHEHVCGLHFYAHDMSRQVRCVCLCAHVCVWAVDF